MALQSTTPPRGGVLKDMNPFPENLALPKATNKDRFSLGSQDSTYNTSDSDPSLDSDPFVDSDAPPDCSRARLSLLVKAMKIGKMVLTGDSTATSSTSPNNVRGGESPASFLVGNSDHSTPESIGLAITSTNLEPGTAPGVNYKRPRAYATVGQNGSPMPRRPVDPSSSPSIRPGFGPMMRTSRDAYEVIMGEKPTFPPRVSSLPSASPSSSSTLPPKVPDKDSVVSRLSRPTAASSARAANAVAIGTARSTTGVKTPSTGRSTNIFNSPRANTSARDANEFAMGTARSTTGVKSPITGRSTSIFNSPSATASARAANAIAMGTARSTTGVKTPIAGRSTSIFNGPGATRSASAFKTASAAQLTSVTKPSSTVKSTNTPRMASAPQTTSTAKSTGFARSFNFSKAAKANRSAKMTKTTGVTRTTSVKRAPGSRVPVRPVPKADTMASLKTAGRGFKTRFAAIVPNRRRGTGTNKQGSEQELSPPVGKETTAESGGESPDEKESCGEKESSGEKENSDEKESLGEKEYPDEKESSDETESSDEEESPDENFPLSLDSSITMEGTMGDNLDRMLSMSLAQFGRLVHAAQDIRNEDRKEASIKAVQAYGEALVGLRTAQKAILELEVAAVAMSRQATGLGDQALASIRD